MAEVERAPYKVKYSTLFEQDLARILGDFSRWEEIAEMIELDLARNPQEAELIPGTSWRAVVLLTTPPTTLCISADDDSETVVLERLLMA